ncbi:hypothetical protein ABT297_32265 [Dactylosporangium sp. NPDC000555]|uniref:hypothetical protein n=1 Tax=Dactylosporangium sp. NPDC000555 TaxID=3154260 RepID=UPI00332BA4A2
MMALAERLALTQPGTWKHLRVLREAGLVRVRPEAQRRIYELRRHLERAPAEEEVGSVMGRTPARSPNRRERSNTLDEPSRRGVALRRKSHLGRRRDQARRDTRPAVGQRCRNRTSTHA